MCWTQNFFNICYECYVEWNHQTIKTPCWYDEQSSVTGKPCKRLTHRGDAPTDCENCETCKACRRAEELVQQRVHQMQPIRIADYRKELVRSNMAKSSLARNNIW